MLYIGNKNTKQLHKQSCAYAKKIKPENRVEFDSVQDAFDAGYFGCGHCLEQYDEKNVREFDDGYEQWIEEIKGGDDNEIPVCDADDWCFIVGADPLDEEEKDAATEMEECYQKHKSELGAMSSYSRQTKNRAGLEGLVRTCEHGCIFWTDEFGAYAITEPVFSAYQKEKGIRGDYGFPVSDLLETNTPGLAVAIFEGGAFFVNEEQSVFGLPEAILKQYIALGADKGALGAPCSGIVRISNGFYVSFRKNGIDDGRIYSTTDDKGITDVFALYGDALAQYMANMSDLGLPVGGEESYPMREVVGLVTDITRICYYWKRIPFTNGAIFRKKGQYYVIYGPIWTKYKEINGEQNRFYAPVSGVSMSPRRLVEYVDFSGGVIARREDKVVALTAAELYLGRSVSDSISDGRDYHTLWTTYDVNAELVVYLTVKHNGVPLKMYVRKEGFVTFDDYRLNSHSGSTYDINRTFEFSVKRHTDSFSLKVRYKDWDATNSNDALGAYSNTFDVENLWGFWLDENGIFYNQPLTEGYDASSSSLKKEDTVLTNFAIRDAYGKIEADPNSFMPECWWAFHNYGRDKDYSYNFFSSVFKDMHRVDDGGWTWFADTIAHPSDHLFWAVSKGSGQGGLCFGMSLLALKAIKSESIFSLPLNKYRMTNLAPYIDHAKSETTHFDYADASNEAIRENINYFYLYQLGKAIHDWKLKLIMDGISFSPRKFFHAVRECLDKEKFCVVGVHPAAAGGHALLAYRYEMIDDSEWRIYLADPNLPADPAATGHTPVSTNGDEVYFSIDPKKNTSKIVAPNGMYSDENYYKTEGFELPLSGLAGYISSWMAIGNCSLYYIPYSICSRQPRTINWIAEVLKGVFHLFFGGPVDPYKFSIFFTFGDCADINMEEGTEYFEMPLSFGDGHSRIMVVKDASHFKTRLIGKKEGVMKCTVLNKMRCIDLSIPVEKDEEDTIFMENTNPKKPVLSLMTTKATPKNIGISMKCRNHRRKENLSVDLKLCTGKQAESKIEFSRYFTDMSVYQGGLRRGVKVSRKVETPSKTARSDARVSARTQPVRLIVKKQK